MMKLSLFLIMVIGVVHGGDNCDGCPIGYEKKIFKMLNKSDKEPGYKIKKSKYYKRYVKKIKNQYSWGNQEPSPTPETLSY